MPTKPTRASSAPAFASEYEIASVDDWGSKTETTTILCFANAASIADGRPLAPTGAAFATGLGAGRTAGLVGAFFAAPTGFVATCVRRAGAAGAVTLAGVVGFEAATGGDDECFGFIMSIARPPTAATTATSAKIRMGRPTVRFTTYLSALPESRFTYEA